MEFRAIGCVRSGVYYIDGRCHWIEIINYLCCEGNLFLLAPPTEHGWLTNLVGDIIIFVFHSAVCTGHSQRSRIHSLLTHSLLTHSPERTHTNTHITLMSLSRSAFTNPILSARPMRAPYLFCHFNFVHVIGIEYWIVKETETMYSLLYYITT